MVVTLTSKAVAKVKELMEQQDPKPAAVRLGVRGGGCSGFSYAMVFDDVPTATENDDEIDLDGLKVRVDNMSAMYLEGCEVDYVDGLAGAGFTFNNPNVKRTCGCGSSFSV
jgi:iron-sulfur cluster assembly accessory protein